MKGPRSKSPLTFETLETRDVPAIIDLTVNPINPTEGVPYTSSALAPVAEFTVNNFIGADQSSQFSGEIQWGDGDVSGGLGGPTITFFQDNGNGTASYLVFGSHLYLEATAPGTPLDLNVEIFDNTGPGTTQSSSAPVVVNDLPLAEFPAQPTVSAVIGAPLTSVDVADFTDGNPYAPASGYAVTVDWGDSTPTTSGTVVKDTNGTFHVLASHTYGPSAPATPSVTTTIVDETANLVISNPVAISQAAIVPAASPVTIVEGSNIPAGTVVGGFTDLSGGQAVGNYTATATFPNALGTTALTVARIGSTNTYSLTTTSDTTFNSPAEEGVRNYSLAVAAAGGPSAGATGSLTVTDAPLTISSNLVSDTVTVGAPFTTGPGLFSIMHFQDGNAAAPVGDFTVTINWGDGSAPSFGTVTALGGGSFEVNGTHTYSQETAPGAPYTVTTTVTDKGGSNLSSTAAFTVKAGAITANSAVNVFGTQNQPLNDVTVGTFVDANPNATAANFTATINWGDGTGSQPASVKLIGGNAGGAVFAVYGSHVYTSTVGSPFSTTFSVVDLGGAAPIVDATGGVATISQGAIAVSVLPLTGTIDAPTTAGAVVATFLDLGGADPLASYSATIDWGDGTMTDIGTIAALGGNQFSVAAPTHTYHGTGAFVLKVTVADTDPASGIGGNIVAVANSILTAGAPVAPIPGAVEGAPLTATVAAFTDSDTTGTPSDYHAMINWGDGTPETVGTIVAGGVAGSFIVTGTHTYAEESTTPRFIQTIITDDFGGMIFANTNVNAVADATLTADAALPVFAAEHQSLVNVPVGTFIDANPGATASDYLVSINWGDGTAASTGFATLVGGTAAGAVFSVSGSHVYNTTVGSPFNITYTVVDLGGSTLPDAAGGTATVAQGAVVVTALPLTTTIGTPTTAGVVATFLDLTGADPIASYSATIEWGDGTTSTGTIAALGGNQFSVSGPAHSYATPGTYALKVTVVDSDPATGIGASLVVVQTAAITITPVAGGGGGGGGGISATEGAPLVDQAVATFTSSNPTATVGDFAAIIDWGDGSPFSTGTITQPGGVGTAFTVSGDHTYADESAGYKVIVTVTDNFGSRGSLATTAVVADATLVNPVGIPQYASSSQPLVNAPLGTFSDNNPLGTAADFTATIDWGDGSPTDLGFVTLVGGNGTQAFFSVSGSHLYTSSGSKTVTITVTDDGGAPQINFTTTVSVTGSSLGLQSFPITGVEGNPTAAGKVIGTFSDPSTGPAVTYAVTVDWGDGTTDTDPAVVVKPTAVGSTTFNILAPAHTYVEEGSYVVTITVTPSNGSGPVSSANLATVADAPLTGINGGTIDSVATHLPVVEGNPIGSQTIVSFTDANPLAPVSDFTATIDWGDGHTSTGVISQPGGPGTVFLVSGNHTYANIGTYTVQVSIVDEGGSKTSATASVPVVAATITQTPSQPNIDGVQNSPLVNVEVATFTTNDSLASASKYVATIHWGDGVTSISAGVVTEDASGVFHVSGTHTYANSGQFFPVVDISEGDPTPLGSIPTAGGPAGSGAVVTISSTPLLVSNVDVHGVEGTVLPNVQSTTGGTIVATFIDLGVAAPPGSYTAMINWGNGQSTQGTIIQNGPNFTVVAPLGGAAGNPNNIIYMEKGEYTIQVTIQKATNGLDFLAYAIDTATIVDAPLTADPTQPIVGTVATPVYQQTPLTGINVAKFTDGNLFAPLTDFTATIDWGDGTPQSTGTFSQPGGVGTAIFVTGNHTYANPTTPPASPYTISVSIVDDDGSTLRTTTTANVTASTLTATGVALTGVVGQPLSNVIVAYFHDTSTPGPLSSYSATIEWDGTPATKTIGQIVPLGGSDFAVVGTYTYTSALLPSGHPPVIPPYTVTVAISHNGLPATAVNSFATIKDAAIAGVAIPVFATEGADYQGTVAFFTDANPLATAADFSAVINWGDGSSSNGTVVASGSGFLVQGTVSGSSPSVGHSYHEEGSYVFSVTVTSASLSSFTAYQTATVADAALTSFGLTIPATPTPPIYEYPAFTGEVADFIDANKFSMAPPAALTSDYTATINWGDGITSTGTVTQFTGVFPNTIEFKVTGTHSYKPGVYQITTFIKDSGGSSTTAVSTITITDSVITALAAIPISAVEGTPFTTQVAQFTDANLNGTPGEYTATIYWGDGPISPTTTSVGTVSKNASGTFSVTGSYTYKEFSSPTYPVTVTIHSINGTPDITVSDLAAVSDAPLSSTGTQIQGAEGISTGNVLIATFVDSNPFSNIADFATVAQPLTVDWGDGSPLFTASAANLTAVGSPSGVTYSLRAAHTYAAAGNYQIITTIKDAGGAATVATGTANIGVATLTASPSATQPVIAGTEGTPFSGPVFTFTSSNPTAKLSDYSATINWGDGTTDAGTVTQPGGVGTTFVVVGTHTYLDNGTYLVGVDVFNTANNTTISGHPTATITNVVPTAKIQNAGPVNEGSPVTVSLFDPLDVSPIDTAAGFRYTFATTFAGLAQTYISASPTPSAQFTFPDGPSTQTVFGRIYDKDGGFSDYNTPVTVNNVAPTATFAVTGNFFPKQTLTISLTSPFDPSSVDTAAGFKYTFSAVPQGQPPAFGAMQTSNTSTFVPPLAGTYDVRARIYDKDGGFTEYPASGTPPITVGVVVADPTVIAIGAGPGGSPLVEILDKNGDVGAAFYAYDPTFRGGADVAVGDVTGDGVPDIVTGPGPGGGPDVKIFDGRTYQQIASFSALNDPSFRGGIHVAIGDVNGDGHNDIIVGAGDSGGPVVQVINVADLSTIYQFYAYDANFRGGVNIAVADVNHDGHADIITGAGNTGGPQVNVFSGMDFSLLRSFYAYDSNELGGVTVAAGDIDGDGRVEIVTGPGIGGGADLETFDALTTGRLKSIFAFGPDRNNGKPLLNGMTVAVVGLDSPNGPYVVAGSGPGYTAMVSVFNGHTLDQLAVGVPYDEFMGGVNVG